jgi:hypothetical protein
MKRVIKVAILVLLASVVTGCFGPKELQVRVLPLGEVVPETVEQYMYALPQTVLKVELTCRETRYVRGPFMEFSEKYLGITEVIRQNFSRWQILDVKVTPHTEMDPAMLYQVNVLEGEFDPGLLEPYLARGIILDGSGLVLEEVKSPSLGSMEITDYVRYVDLGIESNFEERTETMYKTIVTDTSFVQVPVDRTITEQKTPATKAREAAEFLLELRSRRFELLTGGYEGFPQGAAMEATLAKLDELEASYLSLFTGKTLGRTMKRAWFIVPGPGEAPSRYRLGMFSGQLGFVPEDLMEGAPLEATIEPLGKTGDVGAYYSGSTYHNANNVLYYRIPDVVELSIDWGGEVLARQRISIFQSGAVMAAPLK